MAGEHGCDDLLGIGHCSNIRVPCKFSQAILHAPDDLAVDGAGNAVLELQVHLWDGVLWEDGSIRDITCSVVNTLYFHLIILISSVMA